MTHGARLAAEVGMNPEDYEFDPDGIKAAFGVDGTVEKMTYRELQGAEKPSGAACRNGSDARRFPQVRCHADWAARLRSPHATRRGPVHRRL